MCAFRVEWPVEAASSHPDPHFPSFLANPSVRYWIRWFAHQAVRYGNWIENWVVYGNWSYCVYGILIFSFECAFSGENRHYSDELRIHTKGTVDGRSMTDFISACRPKSMSCSGHSHTAEKRHYNISPRSIGSAGESLSGYGRSTVEGYRGLIFI